VEEEVEQDVCGAEQNRIETAIVRQWDAPDRVEDNNLQGQSNAGSGGYMMVGSREGLCPLSSSSTSWHVSKYLLIL
jgi:hypothetical protein